MAKTLIVLERSNGWYGGYEKRNNTYEQVFNTDKHMLQEKLDISKKKKQLKIHNMRKENL